ncbi:hypothetical protein H310_11649 [Aphanomyces invadans]|uniref:Uncharacterized protein n=1 Tax=Aphanomyces invadans TaxID=157072 RepID=A0A024TKU2_9STRA|nr:hypothetical protein H310_11649 [Aphanomyces invadans]ETV94663.1 hypothetical protein H310_11649 [Aphanomyces invadans]|eukprot:XP_008876608.1 hypothetical protein H310_11649 [Aphanomyces invadans]
MRRSIVVVYKQARTRVVWYDGTSDAMVEKAVCMQLGLPPTSSLLLKDMDGELVPIAACLPPNDYVVVRFGDVGGNQIPSSITLTTDETPSLSNVLLPTPTPEAMQERVGPLGKMLPRMKRAAIPMASKAMKKTAPTVLMKLFLEAFTVPLAPDDVIHFIPNHGDFGIDKLYAALVPAMFLPQDTTTFYKLASSSIVLDRQRVIRYYRVGDEYTQLAAMGKGPLLRAYVDPSKLALPPHNDLVALFALALDMPDATDSIARQYAAFVHGFTPISRMEFISGSA